MLFLSEKKAKKKKSAAPDVCFPLILAHTGKQGLRLPLALVTFLDFILRSTRFNFDFRHSAPTSRITCLPPFFFFLPSPPPLFLGFFSDCLFRHLLLFEVTVICVGRWTALFTPRSLLEIKGLSCGAEFHREPALISVNSC